MNIAYDHIHPNVDSSATDVQAPGMYTYTDRAPCKTCGGPHKVKWGWRKIRAPRHQASWVLVASQEDAIALIKRAKRRWAGKGSLLIQWYGKEPEALSLFFVPKRKVFAVNTLVPRGFPTSV